MTTTNIYKTRDQYGRTVLEGQRDYYTVAVMVTLPKAYRETYGASHFVNDWRSHRVTYFASRKAALAFLEALVADPKEQEPWKQPEEVNAF